MKNRDPFDRNITLALEEAESPAKDVDLTSQVIRRVHRSRRLQRAVAITTSVTALIGISLVSFWISITSNSTGPRSAGIDKPASPSFSVDNDDMSLHDAIVFVPGPVEELSLIDQQHQAILSMLETMGEDLP